jgi:hypothetical protein
MLPLGGVGNLDTRMAAARVLVKKPVAGRIYRWRWRAEGTIPIIIYIVEILGSVAV